MSGSKIRVLIIENDDDVRDSIHLILKSQGYDVDVASDGAEGVLLCEDTAFDVVIVDLLMPRKEGMETIVELKTAFSELRILAISGGGNLTQIDELSQAKKLGAGEVLARPFKAFELIDALKRIFLTSPLMKRWGEHEATTGP